jgi:hypothetical protein
MVCVYTVEKCKAEGEIVPYGFDWTLKLSRLWAFNTPYALDERVKPSGWNVARTARNEGPAQTGFEYASSGGQSGGIKEPKWPKVLGGTVVDGSITWTAVAISEDSLLEQIVSSDWEVPTGLTGTNESYTASPGQQSTTIDISGGAPSEVYTVTNEIVTTDGHEYAAILELTIAA